MRHMFRARRRDGFCFDFHVAWRCCWRRCATSAQYWQAATVDRIGPSVLWQCKIYSRFLFPTVRYWFRAFYILLVEKEKY